MSVPLAQPDYDGLRPDRIDCVIVNDYMANIHKLRYTSYIEPYVLQMEAMGAVIQDLPKLGKVVILTDSDR